MEKNLFDSLFKKVIEKNPIDEKQLLKLINKEKERVKNIIGDLEAIIYVINKNKFSH